MGTLFGSHKTRLRGDSFEKNRGFFREDSGKSKKQGCLEDGLCLNEAWVRGNSTDNSKESLRWMPG